LPQDVLPQDPSPEFRHSHEPLFPFAPQHVIDGLATLEHSSTELLQMITDSLGRNGPADELYTNLPIDDLVTWHTEADDFEQGGELLYKVGLLYGMNLADEVAKEADLASRLRLTNAEAFDKAFDYLKDSYRGLTDTQDINWVRQKERELHYTGSDILSLANASISDRIISRLRGMGEEVEPNVMAELIGFVDGAIFVDAYRAYANGEEPKKFEEPAEEYTPTYNEKIHEQESPVDLHMRIEFEDLKELMGTIKHLNELKGMLVDGESMAGAIYHARRTIVQFGPNAFSTAVEIESIEAPRYSLKRLGLLAVGGAGVDVFSTEVLHQPGRYVPLSLMIGLGLGVMIERRGRKELQKDAERRGVAFTIAPRKKLQQTSVPQLAAE
jgi:hypothetical protein